jgi:hypothetical protein
MYYIYWTKIGNNVEKVSRKEIDHIIKLGFENCGSAVWELVDKYDLRWDDWFWEALAIGWSMEAGYGDLN